MFILASFAVSELYGLAFAPGFNQTMQRRWRSPTQSNPYTIPADKATLAVSLSDKNAEKVADLAAYVQPIFLFTDNSLD